MLWYTVPLFPTIPSSTLFFTHRDKKSWFSLWAVSYIQQMNLCAVSQPALPLDQAILRSIEQLTGEEARYLHLTYLLLESRRYAPLCSCSIWSSYCLPLGKQILSSSILCLSNHLVRVSCIAYRLPSVHHQRGPLFWFSFEPSLEELFILCCFYALW